MTATSNATMHSGNPRVGSNNLIWLISPPGLLLIASLPLALSLLISPDTYEKFVDEPHLMRSGWKMPLFYMSCIALIYAGSRFATALHRGQNTTYAPNNFTPISPSAIMYLMVVFIALNTFSFLTILRNTQGLIGLVLSGGGDVAKAAVNTEGALTQAQPLLIAFNGYALFRFFQSRDQFNYEQRTIFKFTLLSSYCLTILVAVAKVARYEILPIVFSAITIWAYFKSISNPISLGKLLSYLVASLTTVASLFITFSVLRGASDADSVITSLLGYGPASFNHLVALLNDELHLRYSGTGIYAFPGLSSVPLFESIFRISELIGFPRMEDAFLSEFLDAKYASLNPSYIWVTFFGYVYADVGYLIFPILLVFGFFFGKAWINFQNGNAGGIVWYLYFTQSTVLFATTNFFARPAAFVVLALSVSLPLYERLASIIFSRR